MQVALAKVIYVKINKSFLSLYFMRYCRSIAVTESFFRLDITTNIMNKYNNGYVYEGVRFIKVWRVYRALY
jgi:hypothetical protein